MKRAPVALASWMLVKSAKHVNTYGILASFKALIRLNSEIRGSNKPYVFVIYNSVGWFWKNVVLFSEMFVGENYDYNIIRNQTIFYFC